MQLLVQVEFGPSAVTFPSRRCRSQGIGSACVLYGTVAGTFSRHLGATVGSFLGPSLP